MSSSLRPTTYQLTHDVRFENTLEPDENPNPPTNAVREYGVARIYVDDMRAPFEGAPMWKADLEISTSGPDLSPQLAAKRMAIALRALADALERPVQK